ncbi:LPS translocon maturation chaperone LptM [Alkalilimnicola sp. S0819]|nr:lipoprotein [Alkalilimnicola sp. S0819]KAB7622706.1 lipoprotein [Alkalilimnicola sp. S0819]MPQ17345.1 hypothetical protein [Alkalilimnicola sp. S0819]
MRTKSILLLSLLLLTVLLSACGQKGPLYLPEPDEQEQGQ